MTWTCRRRKRSIDSRQLIRSCRIPGAGGIPGAYTYFGSGTGRNGRKRPQDIYSGAVGPRLGFAYSINDKTVLRGGYGIFYEPLKEGSFADQDGLGFFNRQTISPTNGGPTQIDNGVTHIFPPQLGRSLQKDKMAVTA